MIKRQGSENEKRKVTEQTETPSKMLALEWVNQSKTQK
jgi:hypothetical protein